MGWTAGYTALEACVVAVYNKDILDKELMEATGCTEKLSLRRQYAVPGGCAQDLRHPGNRRPGQKG